MRREYIYWRVVIVLLLLLVNIGGTFRAKAISPLEAIETYKKDIVASSRKTGVWASVTAAQLILESGNPMSKLATVDNNFFGIKWSDKFTTRYPGSYAVTYGTTEDFGNGLVAVKDEFAHFPSPSDGITEHSIIWWNGNYGPELEILYDLNSSMDSFLREMANGPYATDPGYYSKLRSVIDSNNLEELDKLAFPEGRKYCGFNGSFVGEYKYLDDGYNADDLKEISKSEKDESTGITYKIVEEEDLVGMYPSSFFEEDLESIDLPSYDSLTTLEKYRLEELKESYKENIEWKIWDTIRAIVIFIGLVLIVYSILFFACFIFDRVNVFFEISLISVISLGVLRYSDDDSSKGKGLVNKRGLIRIVSSCMFVGFFLISGSIFSIIMNTYIVVGNLF